MNTTTRRGLAALAAGSLAVAAFAAAPTMAHADSQGKAYVCKYVQKPGTNEIVKSGKNPILVSVNAIDEYKSGKTIKLGDHFADGQELSLVVGLEGVPGQPDVAPGAECPEWPTSTPTATPTVTTTSTITKTITETVPGKTITETVPGKTITETAPGKTVTETVPGKTVTETAPGQTVTITLPAETVTKTLPAETVTTTLPGETVTKTLPAQTITKTVVAGKTETKTVAVTTGTKATTGGSTAQLAKTGGRN